MKIPPLELKASLLTITLRVVYDEILREMLKALNRGVVWFIRMCQLACCTQFA